MSRPVGKRRYHAFISHAHVDKPVVDGLYRWLVDMANVPIWYDSFDLPAGERIASYLPKAIEASRAAIIVVSSTSVERGWVQEEYDLAIAHKANNPSFRVIPIQIDQTQAPGFLANYKSVRLESGGLALSAGEEILTGLYGSPVNHGLVDARDVYLSRSWHDGDRPLADVAWKYFGDHGFRLIGDAEDQRHWDAGRVSRIIESCGGFLAILPYREDGPLRTSKYILRELELAHAADVPAVVVADHRVELGPTEAYSAFVGAPPTFDIHGMDAILGPALERLEDDWRTPRRPSYVFYATDIGAASKERNDAVRRIVEAVTGMPCIIGQYIRSGGPVQQEIVSYIRDASVVIANISDDNLNTCVEAGMARACGRQLYLVRGGSRGRPPFMFRDLQVFDFDSDADLLGRVHSLLYRHRRRILSHDLEAQSS